MDVSVYGTLFCVSVAFLSVGLFFLASAVRIVPEKKRLRVFRLGKEIGVKGPGIVIVVPIIDRAVMEDLK